jgi:hypothetical protein
LHEECPAGLSRRALTAGDVDGDGLDELIVTARTSQRVFRAFVIQLTAPPP